jgi:hypothetical protein
VISFDIEGNKYSIQDSTFSGKEQEKIKKGGVYHLSISEK